MSINRGMNKQDVLHIYNGTLLSHKKEENSAFCRDRDGPRNFNTEWNKSKREKQTSFITYMWNLGKRYRWTYWQNRNRLIHIENKHDYQDEGVGWTGRLRFTYDTTIMAESEEELKSVFMRVKEEREKVGLKLNIKKTKIMASSPITSLQIDGGKTESRDRFYFLGLQNHCRWEL